MPGSNIAPAHQAFVHRHASEIPKDVWRALLQHERPANILLPFAMKAKSFPRDDNQLWIVGYDDNQTVEFVLSCTRGPVDNYPIFIVSCKSSTQLAQEEQRGKHLADALSPLVMCLLNEVPPQRVFSVFALAKVATEFAGLLEARVRAQYPSLGIEAHVEPYYDATSTYCTSDTLRKPAGATMEGFAVALRRADMSHLGPVTAMCKAFSETSPPFILDDAGAELEARLMIANQQAWVHIVQADEQEPEIACLVATTRESDNVTAVTKVFTTERWRGHGCAARLLYRVCEEVLQKKKWVVLYVGNSAELASARKVYHKVGFQGLDAPLGSVKDVEQWTEIGFKNTTLGYW